MASVDLTHREDAFREALAAQAFRLECSQRLFCQVTVRLRNGLSSRISGPTWQRTQTTGMRCACTTIMWVFCTAWRFQKVRWHERVHQHKLCYRTAAGIYTQLTCSHSLDCLILKSGKHICQCFCGGKCLCSALHGRNPQGWTRPGELPSTAFNSKSSQAYVARATANTLAEHKNAAPCWRQLMLQ